MDTTGEEDTQGQCLLPDDKSGLLVELVMLKLARLGSPLSLLDGYGNEKYREWTGRCGVGNKENVNTDS